MALRALMMLLGTLKLVTLVLFASQVSAEAGEASRNTIVNKGLKHFALFASPLTTPKFHHFRAARESLVVRRLVE